MRSLFTLILLASVLTLHAQTNIVVPKNVQSWIDKELAKAPVKTLLKDFNKGTFFAPKTSRVIGYLKGYNAAGSYTTGMIYTANNLTREDYPTVVKINPDGSFEADFILQYPQINNINIDDVWIPFYLEPGQTVAVIVDKATQEAKKLDKGYYRYAGTTGQINNELAAINFQSIKYTELNEAVKTIAPDDFKKATLEKWKNAKAQLRKEFNQKKLAATTQVIALANQDVLFATNLFDYAMYRQYEKSDTANKIVQLPLESSFFNFINDLNLNNRELLISNEFSTFINRLEYSEPVFKANRLVNNEAPALERELRKYQVTDSLFYVLAPQHDNLILQIIHVRALPFNLRYVFDNVTEADKNSYLNFSKKQLTEKFLAREQDRLATADLKRKNNIGTDLPDTRAAQIFKGIVDRYKGKRLYVDFWATTCGPCVAGIKSNYAVREKFNNTPEFDFVFITSEDESPKDDYNKFIQEQKLGNTHYLKISDYHYLRELFKFNGIPRYVIINEEGKLVDDNFQMYSFQADVKKHFPQYGAAIDELSNNAAKKQ